MCQWRSWGEIMKTAGELCRFLPCLPWLEVMGSSGPHALGGKISGTSNNPSASGKGKGLWCAARLGKYLRTPVWVETFTQLRPVMKMNYDHDFYFMLFTIHCKNMKQIAFQNCTGELHLAGLPKPAWYWSSLFEKISSHLLYICFFIKV